MSKRQSFSKKPARNPQDDTRLPISEELFLQPWFVPKSTYLILRSLLPSAQLLKMRYYFEDFGCLRCEHTDVLYGSNGLCEACSGLVRGRVKRALQRRLKQAGLKSAVRPDSSSVPHFTRRMEDAQRLLRDFRQF
jgi:hypothetical protein